MASQGPNSSTSGNAQDDSSNGGSVIWSGPTNTEVSDDNLAELFFFSNGTSDYLKDDHFGFSIPAGATIDGILLEAETKTSNATGITVKARLVKGGTVQSGASQNRNNTSVATSDRYDSYGGSADLWNNTWTVSDINAANFGYAIEVVNSSGGFMIVDIDHVRMTVFYTVPGQAPVAHMRSLQPILAQ